MASKCTKYVKATIDIYFQEEHVCCDVCPLMETYSRKQCRRTGNYLVDTRTIDPDCPLNFEITEKENKE